MGSGAVCAREDVALSISKRRLTTTAGVLMLIVGLP